MKITFIYLASESLAIEYLSSALKAHGHQTHLSFDPGLFDDKQYLDIPSLAKLFDSKKMVIEDIVSSKPDLVAFSVGTDNYLWAKNIAQAVKERTQVSVIFGGIHATAVPERVLQNSFVDMVCLGEGEEALVELADSFSKNERRHDIKNIWFKYNGNIIKNPPRDLIPDLDTLPLPDKSLFEKDVLIRNGKYMIMTSRGCPYKCTYCYNDVLKDFYFGKGKFVRQRSVKNVLNELVSMKDKYKYTNVAFMDDLFVGNRPWFKEFIPQYTKLIGLPYSCMTSTHVIDEEMVHLLKESGCTRLQFGIQTMNIETRNEILRRSFEKTDDIKRALSACDKLGVSYSIDHIFGIPGEGQKEYRLTAEFFAQTKADRICCYALFYYPKTHIIESAKARGMLNDQDVERIEEGKAKLYVYGSSLRGKDLELFKSIRKFYSLVPLMPKPLRRYIIRKDLYSIFKIVPRFMALLSEIIMSLKSRHPRGNDYIKYYLYHIVKRIKR
jgi:radical SAM superfamily enzyme YgiQ (UPF0313 family)